MRVTVVGAGIVGYAVAYELASRGAAVEIVDMRGAGAGATRASAGMLAPYIEGHDETLLRLGLCSLALYDSFVERVGSDASQPIEYERTGTLEVALGSSEALELERAAQRLSLAGVSHTLVEGTAATELEPNLADSAAAALLIPLHGYVGVGTLMSALAAAGSRLGVTFTHRRIDGVEPTSTGVRLISADGAIESDALVIAAGSWSEQLQMPFYRKDVVRPIRGQLLHLRFTKRPLSRVTWGKRCYMVPWRDGSLLVGATVEDAGFDESATAAGVGQLLESGAELLPSLGNGAFHEVRTGLRPATPDELPLIGSSSTMRGVFYATGHYRNGVLLAPLTAKAVADLIIDGRPAPELELVSPVRFGL